MDAWRKLALGVEERGAISFTGELLYRPAKHKIPEVPLEKSNRSFSLSAREHSKPNARRFNPFGKVHGQER